MTGHMTLQAQTRQYAFSGNESCHMSYDFLREYILQSLACGVQEILLSLSHYKRSITSLLSKSIGLFAASAACKLLGQIPTNAA
jgi:hypothetical protein